MASLWNQMVNNIDHGVKSLQSAVENARSYPTEAYCPACSTLNGIPIATYNWHCLQNHANHPDNTYCCFVGCRHTRAETRERGLYKPSINCYRCNRGFPVAESKAGNWANQQVVNAPGNAKAMVHNVSNEIKALASAPVTFHCQSCNTELGMPRGPWQCSSCFTHNPQEAQNCNKPGCHRSRYSDPVACSICHQSTQIPLYKITDQLKSLGYQANASSKQGYFQYWSQEPHCTCTTCKNPIKLNEEQYKILFPEESSTEYIPPSTTSSPPPQQQQQQQQQHHNPHYPQSQPQHQPSHPYQTPNLTTPPQESPYPQDPYGSSAAYTSSSASIDPYASQAALYPQTGDVAAAVHVPAVIAQDKDVSGEAPPSYQPTSQEPVGGGQNVAPQQQQQQQHSAGYPDFSSQQQPQPYNNTNNAGYPNVPSHNNAGYPNTQPYQQSVAPAAHGGIGYPEIQTQNTKQPHPSNLIQVTGRDGKLYYALQIPCTTCSSLNTVNKTQVFGKKKQLPHTHNNNNNNNNKTSTTHNPHNNNNSNNNIPQQPAYYQPTGPTPQPQHHQQHQHPHQAYASNSPYPQQSEESQRLMNNGPTQQNGAPNYYQ